MSKFALRSLLLGLLLFGANAVQVQPSQAMEAEIRAVPKPTARAVMADENMNLIGRQYYNTLCGYAEGNPNFPVTCAAGYICATANHYNAAGCCNPNELAICNIPSTCIPHGGICNSACQVQNVAYTSCGNLTPYCFTKVFEYGSPFFEYDCATAPGVLTILSTATGLRTNNVMTSPAVETHTTASSATAPSVVKSLSTANSPPPNSVVTSLAVVTRTTVLSATAPSVQTSLSTANGPLSSNAVTSPAAVTYTIVSSATAPDVLTSLSPPNSPPPSDVLTPSLAVIAQSNGPPPSNVLTPSVAAIVESNVASASATPVPASGSTGTSITNISCGSNSECANGQGASGDNNGVGNGKSGASVRAPGPSLHLLLAWVCVGIWVTL